jgi:membrane protein YdbS with pleckstrin-like domain
MLLMSPLFLGPAALAAFLANRAVDSGRLPSIQAFMPLSVDSLRLVNPACLELLGAVAIALVLGYLVLGRLTTRYELTNQRLRLTSGILVHVVDEIELYRIRDVRLVRGPLQLMTGLGTITVDSSEGTGAVALGPVSASARVRETIRNASEAQKAAMGMRVVA